MVVLKLLEGGMLEAFLLLQNGVLGMYAMGGV
jgi:hypothetical protein